MTFLIRLALVISFGLASGALAQTLLGVTTAPQSVGGGTPSPPGGCAGLIDTSKGCPLPMLGM